MVDLDGIWDRFSEPETQLFNDAVEAVGEQYGSRVAEAMQDDEWVAFLYHEAMWDFDIQANYRQGAYDAFVEYMEDNYGIEWDEVYDWEAYREAYDAA